ncbi:MAG: cytochrome c maturation protein CcmE [Acidimicrobiales bacterium]
MAVFVLLAAALVFLLVEGLGNALNYYDTVTQALAHKSDLGTSTFRLQGYVVPGSIHPTAAGTDFDITQGHHTVAVDNTGTPPQLFQPNIGVVVVGHFASAASTDFLSNQILVKHSSTYAPAPSHSAKAKKGTTN